MFERYSELARQAVFFALMEAQDMGTTAIDTDQLLIGILTAHPELPNEVALHVAPESMRSLREQPRPFSASSPKRADLPITPDLRQVMSRAVSIADLHHCQEIRTEHLFASLLEGGGKAAKLLAAFQIETQTLSEAISRVDCSKPQKATEDSKREMSSIMAKKFS